MEYLVDTELHDHLEGLGAFMEPGAKILFMASVIRRKILWKLESFLPPQGDVELAVYGKSVLPPCEPGVPCVLTRR